MIKTIGYYMFAFMYNLYKVFPVKKKKILCIMTHDDGEGNNVSLAAKRLAQEEKGYSFSYITKSDMLEVKGLADLKKILVFFFIKPYQMARAEIILLDNIFLPYAYLRRRKNTKVIQLWHGTGTIKKFGQDSNQGKLKELEKRANSNITHLIVNSMMMKELYAGAFGIDRSFIYPIGLPKTDELLCRIQDEKRNDYNKDKQYIYQKYAIPHDKKLLLYAPTFRDQEASSPRITEQLETLLEQLPEDYYIGLRLHPFVAKNYKQKQKDSRVIQLSFEADLNTVLMASDILITDYSSIVFEYCLLERPMVFYAYDYQEFSDRGRGFYYDYQSFVPGPVAYTGKEVMDYIKKGQWDYDLIRDFKEKHYTYLDAGAIHRVIELIEK